MGTIPGPKKLQDFDSFIWPLMQELLQLELGVKVYDVLSEALFILHAYLIIIIGDIPAISLLMHMKGHNARLPCHMCKIIGVRGSFKTYYVPLNCRNCRNENKSSMPAYYEPSTLPIHTHDNFFNEAHHVQFSLNAAIAEKHAKEYGIKGILVLSALSSLVFPSLFPYDFMHLIWENLIPNLISLWIGNFKGLPLTGEEYVLEKAILKEVCKASVRAGDTIPTAFGCHAPNLEKRREFTTKSIMLWTLYITAIVLRGRFKNQKYYDHFIDLVCLLSLCLDFELPRAKVTEIEDGFSQWVKTYEQLVASLEFQTTLLILLKALLSV